MLQCTSLRSVACFSDNLKASLKKWIYLQCRSKALSELQSCGVMVSVTNGAPGIKWAVSFLATFGSHIRLVFKPGWTGQALAAAWGLFQIDGGECLCQTFGKGFLNKVQVCPVAGQEPALLPMRANLLGLCWWQASQIARNVVHETCVLDHVKECPSCMDPWGRRPCCEKQLAHGLPV